MNDNSRNWDNEIIDIKYSHEHKPYNTYQVEHYDEVKIGNN